MAASRFIMQIVDGSTGEVVSYNPGGPVERAFIDDCVKLALQHIDNLPAFNLSQFVEYASTAVEKRGVGYLRGTAHVTADVKDGLREAIIDGGLEKITKEIKEELSSVIRKSIEATIYELKLKVNP